jgi:hypothetical protein
VKYFENLTELYYKVNKKKRITKQDYKVKPLRNETTREKIYLSENGSVLPNVWARWK